MEGQQQQEKQREELLMTQEGVDGLDAEEEDEYSYEDDHLMYY